MPATRITSFGGIVPRLAARQLPGESAQEAANVSLLPGELRPMRKVMAVWAPVAAQSLESFFRLDDDTWFAWPTPFVQMELAPLEGEARYVYTGDGIPKITTRAMGTPVGVTGVPAAARALGVPAPVAVPTLIHSGGTGAPVTRYYIYTFVSDWNEESAPSPLTPQTIGKVDDTWTIGNMDATPPNSGAVTAAAYAAGFVTVTLGAGNHYLRAGESVTLAAVLGMTDLNGPHLIDSVPAPNQVKIALTTAQAYTSGGTWARDNAWGPCTKRVYRTSGSSADFQLVAEGLTGATYADSLTDVQIPGDSLISQLWQPPPVNLVGLVALTSGVMAGFLDGGKTVCLSEPFQPHAWPVPFQRKVGAPIIGLAAYDNTLVVATAGCPEVLAGLEPEQMSPTRHRKPLPALSRASICTVADGVVFASKNGLVRVDLADAGVFTEPLWSPEAWNNLEPASMACAFDGSRLLISTPVGKRVFLLDMLGGEQMVSTVQAMESVRGDAANGDVYFASSRQVYRFNSWDAAPQTLDWWSKEYVLGKPTNMGAAKVEYDEAYSAQALVLIEAERAGVRATNAALMALPLGGRGGYNSRPWNAGAWAGSVLLDLPPLEVVVSFTLYARGALVYSKLVPNQLPFTLPNGYKADNFSVRVQANTQIRAIVVADTMKNLAAA